MLLLILMRQQLFTVLKVLMQLFIAPLALAVAIRSSAAGLHHTFYILYLG